MSYKISGVPVLFPDKPYPSQFSMMDRIIKGIERRQHCLLESPTGSGKSLALLCSSLAWLAEEKAKKNREDQDELDKGSCVCACHVLQTREDSIIVPSRVKTDLDETVCFKDDDEDEFKKDPLNFNMKSSSKKNSREHISIEYESEGIKSNTDGDKTECKLCNCGLNNSPVVNRKIPKIFFGTRTHKQVAQIVRELRKTEYKDVNMTILASREHTCIHHAVSKMKSKNEGCKELLNGPGCPLKDRAQRYTSHQVIKGQGLSSAWDLEDLIGVCQTKKICPYFLSRGLKEEADLVICPYNYLVDPLIREAMSINLKGDVVILDEAHNIEDSSREAASQTIPQETITSAVKDMEELMQSHNLADYSRLVHVLRKLDNFIEENKNSLEQKEFNQSYKIWNGFHIVAQLEAMGLGPKHFPDLKKALAQIKADTEERKEEAVRKGIPNEEMKPATLNVLDQLFMVMDFLYRQDLKYVDDYRASLIHSISYVPRYEENQWLNSRHRSGGRRMMQVDVINLNFWCMNPAVAFSDFVETRSVILTSGTLSPMMSFQSELGLDFKIQLEANHIIKDSQVWVGSFGQGPNGTSLLAVYRNLESFTFQDELGQVVLQVCKTVPHGVLCFLPSYKVLDKLYTRWESTGLMDKVSERKKILREPRSSSKEDFEEQIATYYRAVEKTDDPNDTTDGAIMFAVCRGKVSEGLDFADNFARAVISVGIPYPNFKDIQVELKRKYNDQHRHERGLLSGSDWYEIQAFRALNQALGRCIRHRNDWGALIIIDERFIKSAPKYSKGLSKWVRNKMCTHDNYSRGMNSLKEFIFERKRLEEEEKINNPAFSTTTPVTPKTACLNSSIGSTDGCCKGQDYKKDSIKSKELRSETPNTESPNPRQYSIFNMMKSKPKSTSKQKNYPKLSSIATPLSKNIPRVDPSPLRSSSTVQTTTTKYSQLPTAVVNPSFVLPPKPLAPIFSNLNQHNTEGGFVITAPQQLNEYVAVPPSGASAYSNPHVTHSSDVVHSMPDNKSASLTPWTGSTKAGTKSRNGNTTAQKISNAPLRIVTPIAPPGTRMQVFQIESHLHKIYGGNLNLPVSSTERLVYLVEPPKTPGGYPIARIIKMSKEDKEKLVESQEKDIQEQEKYKQHQQDIIKEPAEQQSSNIATFNNPPCKLNTNVNQQFLMPTHSASLCSNDNKLGTACHNGLSSHHANSADNNHLRENTISNTTSSRICNADTSSDRHSKYHKNEGTQSSIEEEINSSCSLFDSPVNSTHTARAASNIPQQSTADGSLPITSHLGQSDKNTNSSFHNSTNTESSKKNPLLKFFLPSDNVSSNEIKDATTTNSSVKLSENSGKCAAINGSSASQISQDLFQLGEEPITKASDITNDFKASTTRKPLFKINSKSFNSKDIGHNDDSNSLSGKDLKFESDTKCNSSNVTAMENKIVRHSASKSLMSSSSADEVKEDEDDEMSALKVKRKCGRKRRSLSLKSQNEANKNKKCRGEMSDTDEKEINGMLL